MTDSIRFRVYYNNKLFSAYSNKCSQRFSGSTKQNVIKQMNDVLGAGEFKLRRGDIVYIPGKMNIKTEQN